MRNVILKNITDKADKKFDPFEYENLFYEYKIKINDDEINQILYLIKNINSPNQKTTYKHLNVLNFPILKKLKEQVINILDKHELYLSDNWAQLYNKNNLHGIHNHYGSIYSGIIYLKGNKPSPTIFYDKNFNFYEHEFKSNTLLMFPSIIPHEVRFLKLNEERLIISFNTDKK